MSFGDRLLYHQIHPAKIASDVIGGALSLVLLWQHRLLAGVLIVAVPSLLSSILLMSFADLEPYRRSPLGRYMRRYMTPPVQVVRMLGFAIAALGAWDQSPILMLIGLATIAGCWFYGAIAGGLR